MIVMTYHKSDFHYDLPDERIARYPLPERSAARMLVARAMDANTVELGDHQVRDLPDYLDPADLLVFNNTRVLPARLYGHKASGGKIEILIERLKSPHEASAYIRASKSPQAGSTLHVGAGTFQPVRHENLAEHIMHEEWLTVGEDVVDAVAACRARGGRVIAVGTTALRALESAAAGGSLAPYTGDTRLFITPGYRFRVVDALFTNFHLPESTLLMLVSAFAGYDNIRRTYQHAIAHDYRFYSYGDAMFLPKRLY